MPVKDIIEELKKESIEILEENIFSKVCVNVHVQYVLFNRSGISVIVRA